MKYPYNLLTDIYGEHIDENHDLYVRGCYLDINALPDKIKRLPESLQEFIRLRYEERLNYTEIAEKTGWTLSHTKSMRKQLNNATFQLLAHRDYGVVANTPWEDIMLYIPDEASGGVFLAFSEGTGDNLLHEDTENGYVDYINWTKYRLSKDADADCGFGFKEIDGGMLMTKDYVKEMSLVTLLRELFSEAEIQGHFWAVIASS